MNIELTPLQFQSLLKLAYLGHWMANGIKTNDERENEYESIMQELYAHAKDGGCESFVARDKREKIFSASKKLDDAVSKIREEYDNEIFWDELIEKLTLRDLVDTKDGKHWLGGDIGTPSQERTDILKKYIDEFEMHGIRNLFLKSE